MTKAKDHMHNLFEAFEELRKELHTVEATPLVSALLFLHTVNRLETHFADRGLSLPEGAAQELQGLLMPTKRVYAHLQVVLGARIKIDLRALPQREVDESLVARTSRTIGIYVTQVSAGRSEAEALAKIGEDCTHLLDYVTRQFPNRSGGVQTPEPVARLMVDLLEAKPGMSVLDFTSGFARMLVELARQQVALGRDPDALTYVGQEEDSQAALLGAIHLALNGVTRFTIHVGNTLTNPATRPETFDLVMADPPLGMPVPHLIGSLAGDPRFTFGRKPLPKAADWLFLQHGLTALKPGGRAVFITAHGPMFRSGTEATIRRDVLATGWLRTVMALPSALYPNMALPVVLSVFDRPGQGQKGQSAVVMVDANTWGRREGRVQVLTGEDRKKLVDLFLAPTETEFATLVAPERIYNNSDAWQPNQYLARPEKEGPPDLAGVRKSVDEALELLKKAEDEVAKAFSDLDT